MYALVLIGLLLALLSPDLVSVAAPPDFWNAFGETAAVVAAVFAAGLAISGYIVWRRGEMDGDEQRFLRRVGRLGRLYRLFVAGAYAFILFDLGWAALAARVAELQEWDLPAFGLALAPFLIMILLAWVALYWADRRLRSVLFERGGVAAAVAHWTLPRYIEFMSRQYLLVILIPLLAIVGASDVLTITLGAADTEPLSGAILAACVVAMILLAGPWLRICWRTQPLPDGDLRRRLYALADRAYIRLGNVLVWRTNLSIANGCMIGLVGPLRYILITDALLLATSQAPEEVEAVFAHEVAHVKYRHTMLYLAMAAGVMGAALMAGRAAEVLADSAWAANGAAVVVLVIFWGAIFGFVSRRCEQECDLYAVQAASCPAACSPPAAEAGRGLCEHRVAVFTAALRRISRLNGSAETARGWRHFSVARRCAFLEGLPADPTAVGRAERRVRRVKTAAALLSLALAAAAGIMILAQQESQTYHPEHPARPEDLRPREPTWLVRLVDRDEMDVVALGTPEFDGQAHPPADSHDGRLAGLGRHTAPADDEVAVADARGHAVAVHPEGERPGTDRLDAGQLQVLDDSVGRRLR